MLPGEPRCTFEMRSRMSSTLLLEAASSSCTSNDLPFSMARQLSHSPHGSPSLPRLAQLSAFARMRAVDVLPVPRGPLNR